MTLDIEGVLAEHRSLIQVGQAKACTCGWEDGFVPDATEAHRAHVASALRAEVGRWLGSEGAKLQVAVTLLAEGAGPGSSLHSWRCEYPDMYGECDCVPETATEVLAALAECVGRVDPSQGESGSTGIEVCQSADQTSKVEEVGA